MKDAAPFTGPAVVVKKKEKKPIKYCKAPQAPKRFKSAFIFFTMHRHGQVRRQLEREGGADKTPDVAKVVSKEWRNFTPEERAVWNEKASLDKERYEIEKTMYTGPWKIPARKRMQKDPAAPKRPMSSFLSFSNAKRSEVKEKNPGMSNIEASKLLAKMWKEAPENEKTVHIFREAELREQYKKEMLQWREKNKKEEDIVREKREGMALNVIANRNRSAAAGTGGSSTITTTFATNNDQGIDCGSSQYHTGGPLRTPYSIDSNHYWQENHYKNYQPPAYDIKNESSGDGHGSAKGYYPMPNIHSYGHDFYNNTASPLPSSSPYGSQPPVNAASCYAATHMQHSSSFGPEYECGGAINSSASASAALSLYNQDQPESLHWQSFEKKASGHYDETNNLGEYYSLYGCSRSPSFYPPPCNYSPAYQPNNVYYREGPPPLQNHVTCVYQDNDRNTNHSYDLVNEMPGPTFENSGLHYHGAYEGQQEGCYNGNIS